MHTLPGWPENRAESDRLYQAERYEGWSWLLAAVALSD